MSWRDILNLQDRGSWLLRNHFPYRILRLNLKKAQAGIPDKLWETCEPLFWMGTHYVCELEQAIEFIKEYKPELSEDKIMSDLKELLDFGYIYFE